MQEGNKKDGLLFTIILHPPSFNEPIVEVWKIGKNWIMPNQRGELVMYDDIESLMKSVQECLNKAINEGN